MIQETGETRDAIMEDDNRQIEAILNANRHLRDKYWIVIFAKPSRNSVDGMPTLVKHIKPYKTKPVSQVGMIVAEVNPVAGTLEWDVNMPQRPMDFNKIPGVQEIAGGELVTETTSIPNAYITQ